MRTGTMGKLYSLDARGKFGFSGGLGRMALGYNRVGFYNWFCGIYAKHYYYGKPYISRMKFYRPANPQTEAQQAWRAVYADSINSWRALSDNEKKRYNTRAFGQRMSGYNLFQKEYLNSHKL
jgi:hypothetical protein